MNAPVIKPSARRALEDKGLDRKSSSLLELPMAPLTVRSVIRSDNNYESMNWNREIATRYVLGFESSIVEASFFSHYLDGRHVKNVIELPTSFGCPVGCRHCASALLLEQRQLRPAELAAMVHHIISQEKLRTDDPFLVTFSGIGEGSFQRASLPEVCRAIYRAFKNSFFTLTTVGFDPTFLDVVERLAEEVPIHWLQISYLHFDTSELMRVVPRADALGFDFEALVARIRTLARVPVRLNYVVIADFNDSEQHIAAMLDRIDGLQGVATLRISALNQTEASRRYSLVPAQPRTMCTIRDLCVQRGFEAYVFRSWRDDNLNCGQLAWNYFESTARGD